MINDWNRHSLKMDFSRIGCFVGRPSDIDMFYIGNGYTIFGEIKNVDGEFSKEQRKLYEKLVNNFKGNHVVAIYINHDKKVENGDKFVDVSMAFVSEYYMKGIKGWHRPKKPMTVQMFFDKMEESWGENYGN